MTKNKVPFNKIIVKGGRLKKGLVISLDCDITESIISAFINFETESGKFLMQFDLSEFSYRHITGNISYRTLWDIGAEANFDLSDFFNVITNQMLVRMLKKIEITLDGSDELNPKISDIVLITASKKRFTVQKKSLTAVKVEPEALFKFA